MNKEKLRIVDNKGTVIIEIPKVGEYLVLANYIVHSIERFEKLIKE